MAELTQSFERGLEWSYELLDSEGGVVDQQLPTEDGEGLLFEITRTCTVARVRRSDGLTFATSYSARVTKGDTLSVKFAPPSVV